ncbi:MAG TPA: hypothetical protein VHS31_10355 [Tepidisphaeraceae bacterium]|nr:hypothetical protein [Tepidisphaeraceae bacterium]
MRSEAEVSGIDASAAGINAIVLGDDAGEAGVDARAIGVHPVVVGANAARVGVDAQSDKYAGSEFIPVCFCDTSPGARP